MYNTSDSPQPPSKSPKYLWPRPGLDDWPRLSWESWLRIYALELGKTYPGDLGYFLSQQTLALAEHARALGAHSPTHHITLAQKAADAEAAWVASLEEEVMNPGIWMITALDESPDGAQRGYFSRNTDDETWIN
jgi:hypothetical protein